LRALRAQFAQAFPAFSQSFPSKLHCSKSRAVSLSQTDTAFFISPQGSEFMANVLPNNTAATAPKETAVSLAGWLKALLDPVDWAALLQINDHGYPIPIVRRVTQFPEMWDPNWFKAICACFPLLDAWEVHQLLRAKGRRNDPLGPLEDIEPPPGTRWDLVIYDLRASSIGDPRNGPNTPIAKIYDLQLETTDSVQDKASTHEIGAATGSTHPGDSPEEASTRDFLTRLMREDPSNEARHLKATLQEQCQNQCGEISADAFNRIWAACIDEMGAVAYKKSGPRGPHQARRRPK
jgi:hypothetical protein